MFGLTSSQWSLWILSNSRCTPARCAFGGILGPSWVRLACHLRLPLLQLAPIGSSTCDAPCEGGIQDLACGHLETLHVWGTSNFAICRPAMSDHPDSATPSRLFGCWAVEPAAVSSRCLCPPPKSCAAGLNVASRSETLGRN
jgi:hypothetical protein